MTSREYNVLFLCTGNSARSIMAECSIGRWGKGKFRGFSAGSQPKGAVHPMALKLLGELNFQTSGLRSKSWDEFAGPIVRGWILFSRSATRRRPRLVRYGLDSQSPPIGEWPIRPPL
jgi:hypothetical protein